jgi:predicted TIM-barrel fold metal-dependent hydrolase
LAKVIIDFHTHILPPAIRDNRTQFIGRDPCFTLLYDNPRSRLATVEDLILSMDQAGVERSIILNIGWADHELCLQTNDYILESISRYPDRLVGFCAIQPKAGQAAIAEIRRCAGGGISGIGEMRPDLQGFDLGDEAVMRPLAEAAVEHHLVLLTHASEPVGHQYPGKGTVTLNMIYNFISRFPDLRLVCAHWGGGLPFYALMPEVGSALDNVWFDTAASPFLYRPQIFRHVSDMVGADKILFGSDYPLVAQPRLISEIRSLRLTGEVEALIMGGNAQRLLEAVAGPLPAR